MSIKEKTFTTFLFKQYYMVEGIEVLFFNNSFIKTVSKYMVWLIQFLKMSKIGYDIENLENTSQDKNFIFWALL